MTNPTQLRIEKPIASICDGEISEIPYALPDLDHSLIQSPINILTADTNVSGRHSVEVHFNDEINAIEKVGHTVQLDLKKGRSITLDKKVFKYKQMHF